MQRARNTARSLPLCSPWFCEFTFDNSPPEKAERFRLSQPRLRLRDPDRRKADRRKILPHVTLPELFQRRRRSHLAQLQGLPCANLDPLPDSAGAVSTVAAVRQDVVAPRLAVLQV